MISYKTALKSAFMVSLLILTVVAAPSKWDGKLVEWATMREAIGQGQSEARGNFSELTSKPNFYGLGAVAGLKGEATIIDGRLVATEVSCCGNMMAIDKETTAKLEGTYLLGAYVEEWNESPLQTELDSLAFEGQIRGMVAEQTWGTAPAVPFLLEGELLDAKIHIVNGACPMHARLNELELPEEKKPFEKTYARLEGKVIGFFADNSVGVRTHPGTSIHAHIVFTDPDSGEQVTGHLEGFTVGAGASLSLPR